MTNNPSYLISYPTKGVNLMHIKKLKLFYIAMTESFQNLENSWLKDCPNQPTTYLDYGKHDFNELINETRKVAIVGLYHIWERNLKELLIKGGNPQGLNKEKVKGWAFDKINSLFMTSKDYTTYYKDYFDTIVKYSTLTNAIKHGEGRSMDKLFKDYPEFFYKKSDIVDADEPLVSQDHITELYETLTQFWENIPNYTELDFKGLL